MGTMKRRIFEHLASTGEFRTAREICSAIGAKPDRTSRVGHLVRELNNADGCVGEVKTEGRCLTYSIKCDKTYDEVVPPGMPHIIIAMMTKEACHMTTEQLYEVFKLKDSAPTYEQFKQALYRVFKYNEVKFDVIKQGFDDAYLMVSPPVKPYTKRITARNKQVKSKRATTVKQKYFGDSRSPVDLLFAGLCKTAIKKNRLIDEARV